MITALGHIFAMILASWRLTELITIDRISEPFRRRYPHYLWGCPRCVSVWAGAFCTLSFVYVPWVNWPFALAWLYLVEWDWRQRLQASVKNRVQAEVERLALQQLHDREKSPIILPDWVR